MNVQWMVPERPQPSNRGAPFAARAASTIGWLCCALAAVAVYTNVLLDDSALQARSNQLAREHATCGERCQVTRMQGQRSVFDYRAEYDVAGFGTVHVLCRRTAIVFGEHRCRAH